MVKSGERRPSLINKIQKSHLLSTVSENIYFHFFFFLPRSFVEPSDRDQTRPEEVCSSAMMDFHHLF